MIIVQKLKELITTTTKKKKKKKKIAKLLVYLSDDFLMKPVKPTYDMYRSNIKTV